MARTGCALTPLLRRGLLGATSVCAVLTIIAPLVVTTNPNLAQTTKPLATALLALLAALTSDAISVRYRVLVTLGLVASLAGDVVLMLPGDWFVHGLLVFLGAHFFYGAAFFSHAPPLRHRTAIVGYATVATSVLALVLPAVGGVLRVAIVSYVVVISVMAAQAASWMLDEPRSRAALLAAIGAALFVASDAMLALDRFVTLIPMRDVLVLGTYWLAQACIASSVQRPPPPTLRMA